MTARIFAIDGGTYFHHHALHGPRYRDCFDRLIDIRALCEVDLAQCDVLVVTCRSHPGKLREAREVFQRFLAQGGTLVAMGETQSHTWLPGFEWTYKSTNFWWWREPGADAGYTTRAPAHAFFRHLKLEDTVWHYHGVLHPPAHAVRLLELQHERGCLLFEDTATTAGRMVVTTLDPFFHHGSYFMPATTRFLDGFMPWLASLEPASERASQSDHCTVGARE